MDAIDSLDAEAAALDATLGEASEAARQTRGELAHMKDALGEAAFAVGKLEAGFSGGLRKATTFPMRGGTGLMGEAGPEAIMPLSRGADGRLGVRTQGGGGTHVTMNISTLVNGFEERNTPWAHSRRRYDAGLGLRSLDDVAELVAFFEARQGQMYGFRWKDWSDYKSCLPGAAPAAFDQVIAQGDETTTVFALRKAYPSGAHCYYRPIAKPVSGTVRVAVGGDEMQESIHFDIDAAAGTIIFADAPPIGAEITAGFEFDKALSSTTGLSVDNTEAAGILTAESITEIDIAAGRYDNAAVTIGNRRQLTLWAPLQVPIVPGDTFRLIAGCDKRAVTCREKFENLLNFQGFPHIPGDDWLMAVPRTDGANDGGALV